jgi:isopentenyl diphosphate isomerase/L-lactate dehydrogenase-like FMN-dependent dehydrogenase
MNLTEIYSKGQEILAKQSFGLLLDGVETGWVLHNNQRVMEKYVFHQKTIGAPATASTATEALGLSLKTPVVMSAITMPIPAICEDGLKKVAEGLKEAGSLMWTGTPLPQDLDGLVSTGVPLIVSIKPIADREKIMADIKKIQGAGVSLLSLEIDAGQGTKIHDQEIAKDCKPFSLNDLVKIRDMICGKMVVKGVLSAYDAELSIRAGADAIMVSNHGAHTVDYLPHPFQVAEEIKQAVGGRVPIFFDGGFRRGTDVLKALAMGAKLVGLGRPILYGLAADGAAGVRDVVKHITAELARTMTMIGAANLAQISETDLIKI